MNIFVCKSFLYLKWSQQYVSRSNCIGPKSMNTLKIHAIKLISKVLSQCALSPTMCDAASESYVNSKYTLLCLGLYHLCFRSIKTNYRLSGLWSQISPLISVFFFFSMNSENLSWVYRRSIPDVQVKWKACIHKYNGFCHKSKNDLLWSSDQASRTPELRIQMLS